MNICVVWLSFVIKLSYSCLCCLVLTDLISCSEPTARYVYDILQQEESLRQLKVSVMTWSIPDRFIMSILRGRCGTVNYHPVLNLIN